MIARANPLCPSISTLAVVHYNKLYNKLFSVFQAIEPFNGFVMLGSNVAPGNLDPEIP